MSPVSVDLKNWQPRPRPARTPLEGRFVRLEPLNAASHGDDLFEIATVPDAADRFRYLSEEPPESRAAFQTWLEKVQASEDPLYFSVIDICCRAYNKKSADEADADTPEWENLQ